MAKKRIAGLLIGGISCCGLGMISHAQSIEDYIQPADAIALNPALGLEGIEAALLRGSLNEEGFYVLRVKFHPGAASAPHTHDQDRYITVLEGTWHFAIGEEGSCSNATPLEAGSFAYLPAEIPHFDGSCSDKPTIVQISGYGPVHTHYIE